MTLLISNFGVNVVNFFLMFFKEGGVSFGVYDISKSLTVPGWLVVIILPLGLIFGAIYLAAKILKKPKLK